MAEGRIETIPPHELGFGGYSEIIPIVRRFFLALLVSAIVGSRKRFFEHSNSRVRVCEGLLSLKEIWSERNPAFGFSARLLPKRSTFRRKLCKIDSRVIGALTDDAIALAE